MTIIEAIILGIIQGLAEFLPISSSGHLAIAKFFFGFENNSISFDVFLHLGTLIAVFAVFYKDVIELIKEFFGICADIVFNFITLVSGKKKPFRKILKTDYRRFVVLESQGQRSLVGCHLWGRTDSDTTETTSQQQQQQQQQQQCINIKRV